MVWLWHFPYSVASNQLSLHYVATTMAEATGKSGDTASSLPTGLDFRSNSTGIKRLQTAYPHDLNDQIYKQGNISPFHSIINVFSLKPDVRRKCQPQCVRCNDLLRRKQKLERSLYDIEMGFYMPCLLFRCLGWNRSWMRQIAEVYAIQFDVNLKRLLHVHLMNSFPDSPIHSTSLEMSEVSSETDMLLISVPQQTDAAIFW